MNKVRRLLTAEEFTLWREEVNRENRLAIHMLAVSGLPLSVANIFAQTFFIRMDLLSIRTLWLLLYFVSLYLFERFIMPKDCYRSTLLIYLLETPPLIVSILLGSVWDPTHQALTFMLFLTVMPVFIFDHAPRLLGISGAWAALFLVMCYAVKDPSTHQGDLFHTIEFYLASSAVTLVVLRVRMETLRSFAKTRYHLEHDAMTGLRNRRSMEERTQGYLGKPLLVLLGDLDQLELYNDFYGQKTGDEMLLCFAETLRGEFGEEHTYRYGGDEIVCIASEFSEDEALARVARCREQLRRREFSGHTISLTCSFGYAYGTPDTEKEFQEIIHLADVYAHKARRRGQGQTIGGPYDERFLRAAIVESRIAFHAQEQQSNQLTELLSLSTFVSQSTELLLSGIDLALHPVVVFFHIIHFRDYNEEFGYAKGDALINHTAKLLLNGFPERYVCNINGAQFGVLCYEDEVARGLAAVDEGLKSYSQDYPVVTKTGYVEVQEGESMISLLDKAKAAHDTIYHHPGVYSCRYDEKMDAENHFRQYIVSHVDEAIEKGWLRVFYQPIVRALTGEICNEEALSRWDDPTYGFLAPFQYIPVLEEARLLYKASLNTIRQVLKDFRLKEEHGVTPVPVSVNLSRYDFEECDMVRSIMDLVDASGYSRSLIRIEITESAFMEDQELLKHEINRLREGGFEVWMDDFGSEYSTLNLLQYVNFDLIKIDMEFMKNFTASGKNMIIVENVINMAHRMGVRTLVEGVETEEHYRLLRNLGCEKLQGFLFSKPNTLENLLAWTLSSDTANYESRSEAPYYEAIGAVDLNAPISMAEQNDESAPVGVPAGVLEYSASRFVCVRGNEMFFRMLQDMGMLPAYRRGTGRQTLKDPPPDALSQAAARSMETAEWVDVDLLSMGKQGVLMKIRRISHNDATGSVALLAILLPSNL